MGTERLYTPNLIYKIQIIQNKFQRHSLKASWFIRNEQIHDDLQMENVLEFITRLTIDFQDNLKNIPNNSINNLLNYDQNPSRLQRRPKFIPELPTTTPLTSNEPVKHYPAILPTRHRDATRRYLPRR